MKASNLFVLGAVGIGLYYVWKSTAGVANAVTNAASATTCAISSGIASFWNSLTLSCNMTVQGNIVLPNGTQVAASAAQIGQDCSGNVYAQYQGAVYQLSGSNSCGNWPATQVS